MEWVLKSGDSKASVWPFAKLGLKGQRLRARSEMEGAVGITRVPVIIGLVAAGSGSSMVLSPPKMSSSSGVVLGRGVLSEQSA